MKSYDFDCVVYGSDYLCVDCLPDGITTESENVYPVFASEEVDIYPVCCVCGETHTYMNLTYD